MIVLKISAAMSVFASNRNTARAVLIVSSILIAYPACAQTPLCDVAQGFSKEFGSHLQASVAQLKNSKRVLEKYLAFMDSRNWQERVPMGDQMTTEELVEVGGLKQQLRSQYALGLNYSKRERDITMLHKMAVIADKTARYGFDPVADTESDDFYAGVYLYSLAMPSGTMQTNLRALLMKMLTENARLRRGLRTRLRKRLVKLVALKECQRR